MKLYWEQTWYSLWWVLESLTHNFIKLAGNSFVNVPCWLDFCSNATKAFQKCKVNQSAFHLMPKFPHFHFPADIPSYSSSNKMKFCLVIMSHVVVRWQEIKWKSLSKLS
jgi:hypothetical protein